MPNALFLSPHLDDVAFSCTGTLLRLLQFHWRVTLITIFTATAPDPQGFALQLQTERGFSPEADYMALRREEDDSFARIVGLRDCRHWNFMAAPSRGYHSAAEVLAEIKDGDDIWHPISKQLSAAIAEICPDTVFAPQGLGHHVDHLQTILAVKAIHGVEAQTRWYRDVPYALHLPDAQPSPLLPADLEMECVPLKEMDLERKIIGCCAYASQLHAQFGGAVEVGQKLRTFHMAEAKSLDEAQRERYAECFLSPVGLPPLF